MHNPHESALADGPIQLFLGSRTDTSQLLSVPRALIRDQASAAGTSQHADPAEGSSSKQVLEPDSVQRLTAFDCAAPIHDAFVFQDPPGEARAPHAHACHATCSIPVRPWGSCTEPLLNRLFCPLEMLQRSALHFPMLNKTIDAGGNMYICHQPSCLHPYSLYNTQAPRCSSLACCSVLAETLIINAAMEP